MESVPGRRPARALVPLGIAVALVAVAAVVAVRSFSGSGSAPPPAGSRPDVLVDDAFPGSVGWRTGDVGGGTALLAPVGYRLSTARGETSVSAVRASTGRSWPTVTVEAAVSRLDGPALAGVGCLAAQGRLYLFAGTASTGGH